MAKGNAPGFHVDRVPQVKQQILDLVAKAKTLGVHDELIDSLKTIVHFLAETPLEWGDPEYHTRKQGGQVYRGIYSPLVVQYAVFENEKEVLILKIRPLPNSPLFT